MQNIKRILVVIFLSSAFSYSNAESIDLRTLKAGEVLRTTWGNRLIYVYKRTPSQIAELKAKVGKVMDLAALSYAVQYVAMIYSNERASQILHVLRELEGKPTRSYREDVLVVSAVSSRAGCLILYVPEQEVFTDPCSGAMYGLDGRLQKPNGRESYHLFIPLHYYQGDLLVFGNEQGKSIQTLDFSPNIMAMRASDGEKLFHAIQWKKQDIALALIKSTGVAEYTNQIHSTALHVAASRAGSNLINKMIDAGFDVNHINKSNITPLQIALLGGHENNVVTLIERGAKTEAFCEANRCTESSSAFLVNRGLAANKSEAAKYLLDLKSKMNLH